LINWITYSIKPLLRDRVSINALSNLIGKLWSAFLNLLSVPIFLSYLGPEAYGLIGLYVSFEVIFNFMDLGLSATINREIAQNIGTNRQNKENKNLLKTFEYIYWPIGFIVAVLIFLLSGFIVRYWINFQNLSFQTVKLAIYIMALMFAARWPMTLYIGAMHGMQKQLQRNIFLITLATLRIIVSILILEYISQDITVFLSWQALSYGLEVLVLQFYVWRVLNRTSSDSANFDYTLIRKVWRFALSFNLVGVLGMLLSSADRLIASKFVPLSDIGYYSVAGTAAGSLTLIAYSIGSAVYPKFAADTARNDYKAVANDFLRYGNLIHYSVFGFGSILILFPSNILYLWTKDPNVVTNTALILLFLAAANLFNSISNIGYSLIIASGKTRIPLLCNLLNFIVFIPCLFILIPKFGILIAAIIWLIENLVTYLVYIIYIGKVFLKGYVNYVIEDTAPYLIAGLFWFVGAKILCQFLENESLELFILIFASIGYFISMALRVIKVFSVKT
jgi:O-antigen/teichoic acid export membrane protein